MEKNSVTVSKPFNFLRTKIVRIILCHGDKKYKVFQISTGRDGSLYLGCPYLPKTTYKAGVMVFPAGVETLEKFHLPSSQASFVTEKKIKFSYHVSGNVRVSAISQGDKFLEYTTTPLAAYIGHLATFSLGRIDKFEEKVSTKSSSGKVNHDFQVDFSDQLPEHVHMPIFAGNDKIIFGMDLSLDGESLKEKEIAVLDGFINNRGTPAVAFGVHTKEHNLKQDIKWYMLNFDCKRQFNTDGKAFFFLISGFHEIKTTQNEGRTMIITGSLED